MENVINVILPRLIGDSKNHTWQTHPHQGKGHLLKKLPMELRAYGKFMPWDWRIVIVLDQDKDDCKQLKQQLTQWVDEAGVNDQTAVRIAVAELESWFLGDTQALETVFPKLSRSKLGGKARYRNPDDRPDPSDDLDRELKEVHYGGYLKLRHSAEIAPHLSLKADYNRSKSFQITLAKLQELLNQEC